MDAGQIGLCFCLIFLPWILSRHLQKDSIKHSAFTLRIFNEVSTILLFAIVFLVTVKNAVSWVWGVVGILLFGILLMLGIKLYKSIREKKSWEKAEKEILEEDVE
ncbi:hypothetical protein [Polaribacter sp. HL-MS24]|uniref:hypothetical protein n=1 Tax=Polaribacter sp. HL-MS24 TaxID=3077735 RepID=UPI002934E6C4|nr:hypothetical protein [Polaribacter sp. HL-MS24]WOC39712.1 hypothetical protein RRF69_08595 [Polaribacter sp. HL-MS24]